MTGRPVLGDAVVKSTTQVAGDRNRVESTTEFKKKLARWLAGGDAGLAESETFGEKYAEKLAISSQFAGGTSQLLAAYSRDMEKLGKALEGLGGLPLDSHLTMEPKVSPRSRQKSPPPARRPPRRQRPRRIRRRLPMT